MSSIIKPTIGRKVHFHPNGMVLMRGIDSPGVFDSPTIMGNQPLDATVVFVWSDHMVNLDIADHFGTRFVATSVTLVQPGDVHPSSGSYCEWMPYQIATSQPVSQPVAPPSGDEKSFLYHGIEEAIQLLSSVPAGDSEFVDRAFNKLREIQWCEAPAPARILNEVRPVHESQGA